MPRIGPCFGGGLRVIRRSILRSQWGGRSLAVSQDVAQATLAADSSSKLRRFSRLKRVLLSPLGATVNGTSSHDTRGRASATRGP